MEIKVGMEFPVKIIWEEIFKYYAGPFEIRVYHPGKTKIWLKCGGEVCLTTHIVRVINIFIEDGILIIECELRG